jgi:hypothetical protein
MRETVKDVNLKRDTAYIRSKFTFLTVAITKLEASTLQLHDSVSIVEMFMNN